MHSHLPDESKGAIPIIEPIAVLRERKVSTSAILIISQPNKMLSTRAADAWAPIIEKPLLSNALVDKIREVCGTE